MKLVRQVSEHDVIAEFLKAEFYHQEYDKDRELFEPFVQKPDTRNERENVLRRALLFRRRGHMWRELPADTEWYEVEIEAEDLSRIRVFPRAQWRKISDGSFHLVDIADRIRRRPGRGGCDAVIAKIQLLRFHLLHTPRQSSVLLIGLDSRSAFTILEGNHRMAAALLVSPELVQTGFHVLCGLSPRMRESCWYETNFANLWRYFKHRARHFLDREADVAYAVRNFLATTAVAGRDSANGAAAAAYSPTDREFAVSAGTQENTMKHHHSFRWIHRLFAFILAIAICGAQSFAQQATTGEPSDQQTATQPANGNGNAQTDTQSVPATPVPQNPQLGNSQSAMPDPSRGPQTPVQQNPQPAGNNSVPATAQPATPNNSNGSERATPKYQEPSGAATAERGSTNGGAASRPAGTAIAPAKQRQVRSLFIKVGALMAGAAAVGTIYALSRGTSSLPPGAHTTSATRP